MNQQYWMIVSEFCALVGLEDPLRICNEASFDVDDVTFALACRESPGCDSFLLIADVATLFDEAARVSCELLSDSVREMVARDACFCISDVSGAVLHLQRFPIQQTTPQSIVDQLQITVGVVKAVRETIGDVQRVARP